MELYLWRRDEYERLYNCTSYNVDMIPVEQRSHKVIGVALITLAVICEVLYVPCIIILWRRLTQNSAYRFMFFIGVVDLMCLVVNGLITGYAAICGFVFCSHPDFIYVAGTFGYSLWVAESSASILLAVNRCVEMSSRKLTNLLYQGNRIWIWICLPMVYSLYSFIFFRPILFSGISVSWFFNPYFGYKDDDNGTYSSFQHSVHNVMVVFLLGGTYVVFLIMLVAKSARFAAFARTDSYRVASQTITIAQVLLISIVNGATSGVYVYIQFFKISDDIILLSTFLWLSSHGMPSVIYLTMNQTIRNDTRVMLIRFLFRRPTATSAVSPSVMHLFSNTGPSLSGSLTPLDNLRSNLRAARLNF